MSRVQWVDVIEDKYFVSAVNVEIYKQGDDGKFEWDSFVFNIEHKHNKDMLGLEVAGNYYLQFYSEDSYKDFIDKGNEGLPPAVFISAPMLFRNVSDGTDFLAREADDSKAYHTITGMIMDKLWEVLWISNEGELNKYRKY